MGSGSGPGAAAEAAEELIAQLFPNFMQSEEDSGSIFRTRDQEKVNNLNKHFMRFNEIKK
jgi:hypothetical protein